MAHFSDAYRARINELATKSELVRARKEAFEYFRDVCKASCIKCSHRQGDVVDSQRALEVLRDVHVTILNDLEERAAGYSAIRWLFMLRRLPEIVFAGVLPTTMAYDSALAEVISSKSIRTERIIGSMPSFGFNVDGGCVRRLLRFCEGVRTLSQIHVLARWCGKGAGLRISKDWELNTDVAEEVRAAVRMYDQRSSRDRNEWSAAGTDLFDEEIHSEGSILVANRMYLTTVPTPDGHTIDAMAMPRLVSTKALTALTNEVSDVADSPWPEESAIAVWIARAVMLYFIERHKEPSVIRQILNTGYLPMGEEMLTTWVAAVANECNDFVQKVVGHSLGIASHVDLLEMVWARPGGVWPLLPRNLTPHSPEMTCIDLCSAGYAVSESLAYTYADGPTANIRAGHFEAAVQRRIDETAWKPSETERKHIGLKLKRGGQEVTDIDAVASDASTLVLVSCKSRLKSGLYDTGDFATVRNAATLTEQSRDKWEKVMAGIKANPSAYNVDFSKYSRIVGVVCMSSVFYAPVNVVVPSTPDGIRVFGLNELIAWLGEQ